MEAATIQTAVSVQSSTGSYRARTQGSAEATETGFLGVISQLTGLTPVSGDSKEIPDDLLSVLAEMMQGMMQNPFTDAFALEVAEASDYLGINPMDTDTTTVDTLMSMLDAKGGAASLLMQLLMGDTTAESAVDTEGLQQLYAAAMAQAEGGQAESAAVQLPSQIFATASSSSGEAQLLEQNLGEALFARTVRASKETLAQESDSTVVAEELLSAQQPVTGFTESVLAAEGQVQAESTEEATSIYQQTLDALTAQLGSDADKFTVKLSPEGLGEISVEMFKSTDGMVSINLIASSSRTAQLLSEQLGALQMSLGENAEITNVAVADTDTDMFYQQYSEQQYQNQNGAPQYQQQNNYRNPSAWNYTAENAADTSESAPVSGLLNTYI